MEVGWRGSEGGRRWDERRWDEGEQPPARVCGGGCWNRQASAAEQAPVRALLGYGAVRASTAWRGLARGCGQIVSGGRDGWRGSQARTSTASSAAMGCTGPAAAPSASNSAKTTGGEKVRSLPSEMPSPASSTADATRHERITFLNSLNDGHLKARAGQVDLHPLHEPGPSQRWRDEGRDYISARDGRHKGGRRDGEARLAEKAESLARVFEPQLAVRLSFARTLGHFGQGRLGRSGRRRLGPLAEQCQRGDGGRDGAAGEHIEIGVHAGGRVGHEAPHDEGGGDAHLVEVDGGGRGERTLGRAKPGGRQQRRRALEKGLGDGDQHGSGHLEAIPGHRLELTREERDPRPQQAACRHEHSGCAHTLGGARVGTRQGQLSGTSTPLIAEPMAGVKRRPHTTR
eukprot:scaffold8021_cov119-Isochrysis_galbana.AAC.3